MKYVPPYESLREHLRMTIIGGKPRPNMTLEDLRHVISRLVSVVEVDEEWYLAQNPDIAEAVREGRAKSARDHYIHDGYFEGRQPFPITVDEDWYLAEYPEVAEAMKAGAVESAQQHFEAHGYREGRRPFPL